MEYISPYGKDFVKTSVNKVEKSTNQKIDGRSALMEEIRVGKQLKKVAETDKATKPLTSLEASLQKRAVQV